MAALGGQTLQRQGLIQPLQLVLQPAQFILPGARRHLHQQIGKELLGLLQQRDPVTQLGQSRQGRLFEKQLLMVLPVIEGKTEHGKQAIDHLHRLADRDEAHALNFWFGS